MSILLLVCFDVRKEELRLVSIGERQFYWTLQALLIDSELHSGAGVDFVH